MLRPETEHEHKYRAQNGETPAYKAMQEVYITRKLASDNRVRLIDFVAKHIAEYKGMSEDKHDLPVMLFEKKDDAHKFANALVEHLNIPREHVAVKAQKFTR